MPRLTLFLSLVLSCAPALGQGAQWFGSYNTRVKNSDPEMDGGQEDPVALVHALATVNQNLIGVWCSLVSPSGEDPEWDNLIETLKATENTGIDVFALAKKPKENSTNRWDHNLPLMAKELSELSLTYPHLVGFTVDDFGQYPADPTDLEKEFETEKDEDQFVVGPFPQGFVGRITQAAHSVNPNFEFWPTVYFEQTPYLINDGIVLGSTRGVRMRNEEYAAAFYDFHLDVLPASMPLSFQFLDTNEQTSSQWGNYRAYKRVVLNDEVIFEEDFWEYQYVEFFEEDLATLLDSSGNQLLNLGDNRLEIRVDVQHAGTGQVGVNAYHQKMLYVWDLDWAQDGVPFADWALAFDSNAVGEDYTVAYNISTAVDVYDRPSNHLEYWTRNNARDGWIVAQTTEDWHIGDRIDGVLIVYPISTSSTGYVADNYEAQLSALRDDLAGGKMLVVHYAELGFDDEADVPSLEEQIAIDAGVADGIVMYDFPLTLLYEGGHGGIFAERTPTSGNFPDGLMGFFPPRENGMTGWYQSWSIPVPLDPTEAQITFRIVDSKSTTTTCSSGCCGTDYFTKRLYLQGAGVDLYCDGLRGDEGEESYTFDLSGDGGDVLEFRYEYTDFVGNYGNRVHFEVTDGNGVVLPASDWTYTSGTTDGWHRDVLEAVTDLFQVYNP